MTVVTVPFLKNIPSGEPQLFDNALIRWLVALAGRMIAAFWCQALGFSSSERLIGLSNIYWGGVAASMPCRVRFYDANDDHLGFTSGQPWLRESMHRFVEKADLIFYVSNPLLDKLSPRPEQRCVELGNGVEFDHFAVPRPETPEQLCSLPGPILGYAGAMDWIDADLVASVARAWPEYSVVLVGPAYAHDWADRHVELLSLPNVHWVGKVGYDELPAWVQRFDLALMPLERSPLKRASNPNKLYEYAAAGVPILAIDYCDAVRKASGVAHVASTPEEFVRLVTQALADGRKAARQAFARAHSWEALAETMVHELRNAMQRRLS
ncbi:MAG TPA: glycosyltransferase family 1 protein [Chlorobaculum sp.]|uniref:Glycosyl transferase, group 1 family protein n=1 Tax=Chlorobaculum tepidum (strain ATCC 49652 / DSM 12025 / NBRC 103806 / TLS) TaxID=194439 RepID=Q8KAF5_CHLTE|nr:glycosyl transferase, group 1 family protein [Chlorobaculum tepidum TLS]HBU23198.1 glycosyltransferase family 1 protein [Chlorobaculum sp.]